MHRILRLLLPLLALVACAALQPARAGAGEALPGCSVDMCEADLRTRLSWLASDALQGRDTISPQAREASSWIAEQWRRMGLLPKGSDGTWFQPFSVPQPVLKPGNALKVTDGSGVVSSYLVEQDWNPFSLTRSGTAEGDVVFAGYGISAPGDRFQYDDYDGIDVKGKIVLVFRKNPGWREQQHASFRRKLQQAARRGAAALLLCNNPATSAASDGQDVIGHWSASLGVPAGGGPIPYAFVSQHVARTLLAPTGRSLEEIESALRTKGPQSTPLAGMHVEITTALATTKDMNARNVVGFLPGTDPEVSDEVVVLGAHYDHVGLGTFGSLGGASAAGKVHNGADDNGSGTVTLLELAEWFAHGPNRPRRSLLFIAFTGEERGLLGSRHYVAHPTIPLEDVVAMLNMDMVGRSVKGRMEMGGVGTARGLKEVVASVNADIGLKLSWDPGGEAPTDSTSFFRKKIPVLFFFTGLHEDYHRPSDDVERINFPDMERICRLVGGVCREIADGEERLVYTEPPAPKRPPVIGIVPLREPDERGVVVAQVPEQGPAGKAGMEAGDVIVSIAGNVVRDLQTLRAALGKLEAGKTVPVVVLRGEERVTLKVTLGARPGR